MIIWQKITIFNYIIVVKIVIFNHNSALIIRYRKVHEVESPRVRPADDVPLRGVIAVSEGHDLCPSQGFTPHVELRQFPTEGVRWLQGCVEQG